VRRRTNRIRLLALAGVAAAGALVLAIPGISSASTSPPEDHHSCTPVDPECLGPYTPPPLQYTVDGKDVDEAKAKKEAENLATSTCVGGWSKVRSIVTEIGHDVIDYKLTFTCT
jgi:hypothetical protein